MEYRYIGKTGIRASVFTLGTWLTAGRTIDAATTKQIINSAIDFGVNSFDTAEIYAHGEAEEIMGSALRGTGEIRDSYIVSTKVFWGGPKINQIGLNRMHITNACNSSLKRLGLDYIDIYYCHRPDTTTSTLEIVRSMDMLFHQGKILNWGTSCWRPEQIMEAILIAKHGNFLPPIVEQAEYNIFTRDNVEKHLSYLSDRYEYGLITTMPLSCGVLTNKYASKIPRDSRADRKELRWFNDILKSEEWQTRISLSIIFADYAKTLQLSSTDLALIWALKNSKISSLAIGASSKEQLESNILSLNSYDSVSSLEIKQIDSILHNKPAEEYELDFATALERS